MTRNIDKLLAKILVDKGLIGQEELDNVVKEVQKTARPFSAVLIEQGLTNKAIATELSIEVQTVKNHVHNILEKLDLRRRTQVARYAREEGWFKAGTSASTGTSPGTHHNAARP